MKSEKTHKYFREIILIICVLLALFFMLIWVRTLTIKTTYNYAQNQRKLLELSNEIQQKKVMLLKLTSPQKLEILAKKLGLSPPGLERVVKYK